MMPRKVHHAFQTLAFALAVVLTSSLAFAVDWKLSVSSGDYMVGENWEGDVVPDGTSANIPTTGDSSQNLTFTVTLDAAAPNVTSLFVGAGGNFGNNFQQTNFTMNNGASLHSTGGVAFGWSQAQAIVTLNGNASLSAANDLTMGGSNNQAGGSNVLSINDTATISANKLQMGIRGTTNTINQTGGSLTFTHSFEGVEMARPDHATIGTTEGTTAIYNMSGGTLTLSGSSSAITMGRQRTPGTSDSAPVAHAEFNQTGGIVTAPRLFLGNAEAGFKGSVEATYRLHDGTLNVGEWLWMGRFGNSDGTDSGASRFELGNAAGTGTLQESSANTQLIVRENAQSDSTFVGWGTVDFTGNLTNNGRVIADGYGTDRTLDMSSFTSVTRTMADADMTSLTGKVSGWYARNGGRLEMPTQNVSAGNSTVKWGDDAANQRMANSLWIDFAGATTGTLDIALLATDRADVQTAPAGISFIGVWNLTATESFDSATLTLRYDAELAELLELSEDDLRIYHFTDGSWVDVTGALDTTNHLITSTAVTGFSNFAVGAIPEPASLLLLGAGTVLILGRRRRMA